jgi:capsular exopolysaccharide synthesis family protein
VFLRSRKDSVLQAPGDVGLHLRLRELGSIPHAENLKAPGSQWYHKLRSDWTFDRLPGGWHHVDRTSPLAAIESGGPAQREVALISWREADSIVAESFRAALASVLFTRQNGQRPRIVVITSACPGDGKTAVASNFGIGLAKTNHKVLLVDGDMRRPRIHKVFGVPNKRGLSDLLSETKPFTDYQRKDFAVPTQIPGLFVLPSGEATAAAPDLLYSVRAAKLLDRLREEFDSVLIDTPPLALADARALGKLADGVILVVRADQTSAGMAVEALRRLADDGSSVLGTILNNWNPKKTSIYRYGQSYMSYIEPMS